VMAVGNSVCAVNYLRVIQSVQWTVCG